MAVSEAVQTANIEDVIEQAWNDISSINVDTQGDVRDAVLQATQLMDQGVLRVAEKADDGSWKINEWLKKAILLYFRLHPMEEVSGGPGDSVWWDKVPSKFEGWKADDFSAAGFRAVPNCVVRYSAFIGKNTVLMPSFVNIGAYVDEGTMVDTWCTIGSCAQIGKNCHISGGVGIGGVLEPWHGSFGTEGWRNGGAEKPRKHESISVWRDEEEIKTYRYEKDGSFLGLKITEDGKDKSPKDLPDDLVQQTTDALTATLHMMDKVAAGEDCEGKSEVFDGKRRFVLKFNHEEDVMLKKSRYNNYGGKAARCTVEVVPMTGAWYKKPRGWLSIQEQGREKGTLPTVWFAPITQNGPAVPVKMRIKTDYGTLFMHMAGYQTDSALRDDNLVTAKADLKDE